MTAVFSLCRFSRIHVHYYNTTWRLPNCMTSLESSYVVTFYDAVYSYLNNLTVLHRDDKPSIVRHLLEKKYLTNARNLLPYIEMSVLSPENSRTSLLDDSQSLHRILVEHGLFLCGPVNVAGTTPKGFEISGGSSTAIPSTNLTSKCEPGFKPLNHRNRPKQSSYMILMSVYNVVSIVTFLKRSQNRLSFRPD